MRASRVAIPFLALAAAVEPAPAQGCAACLASAMSQGMRAIEAMNAGILVLLIPSFLIIAGVFAYTFTRRLQ